MRFGVPSGVEGGNGRDCGGGACGGIFFPRGGEERGIP